MPVHAPAGQVRHSLVLSLHSPISKPLPYPAGRAGRMPLAGSDTVSSAGRALCVTTTCSVDGYLLPLLLLLLLTLLPPEV
jgi:hypothetical protein